jgi:hypothetical protein
MSSPSRRHIKGMRWLQLASAQPQAPPCAWLALATAHTSLPVELSGSPGAQCWWLST